MVSVVSTKFKLLTSGKSKLWIAIVMLSISFLVRPAAGDFCKVVFFAVCAARGKKV